MLYGFLIESGITAEKPTIKKPYKPVPLYMCPMGWEKVQSLEKGGFVCMPKKPAPVKCPEGTQWVDNSRTKCQGCGTGELFDPGLDCYGCVVGCFPVIPPPR